MKVEVLIAHGPWSRGAVIPDMPANAAREKIRRGLVREAGEEKAMRSPFDRMLRGKSIRRKG